MIKLKSNGSFSKTYKYLNKIDKLSMSGKFNEYGKRGVEELRKATPKDTGKTANSWDYKVVKGSKNISVIWFNTNEVDNVNIAVVIQYGHATKNGGFVRGIDYINPAIKPIFEDMAKEIWEEIKS